jgi:hypothetical protein
VPTDLGHSLAQSVQIQWAAVNHWNVQLRVALFEIQLELLQKVDLGARSRLERVEPLEPGLEPELVGI